MKDLRGYVMIMGAATFWGSSATLAKHLINQHLDTLTLVQTRVAFSAAILVVVLSLAAPQYLRLRLSDLWRFAVVGVVGLAGANFTYYFTIKESTVATGITIQYTAPLFVMVYEIVRKEEQFSIIKLLAALMSLTGCFLAVTGFDLSTMRITPRGLLSGFGSIIAFSFLTIAMRHLLARYAVWTVTTYTIVFASFFWMLIDPPWRMAARVPSSEIWVALLALAIGSVLLPNLLFTGGLRYVVPSRAIITSTFEPVVAIASAALFIGECVAPLQVAGACLVILAIIVLQRSKESGALPEPTRETEHGKE